jgi:hypothetical protein
VVAKKEGDLSAGEFPESLGCTHVRRQVWKVIGTRDEVADIGRAAQNGRVGAVAGFFRARMNVRCSEKTNAIAIGELR